MKWRLSLLVLAVAAGSFVGGAAAHRAGLLRVKRWLGISDPAREADRTYHDIRVSGFRQFPSRADIVMVGDSMIDYLHWDEAFPGVRLVNRGVTGDQVAFVIDRIDTILSTEAHTAFVMLGANDLIHDQPVDDTVSRYADLVQRLSATMQVHVISTLSASGGFARLNPQVAELNSRLRAMCGQLGCNYVDLNGRLAPDGVLPAALTPDGLHLNGEGYRIWTETIAPLVDAAPKSAR